MVAGVEVAGLQLLVILGGAGTQGQEAGQEPLFPSRAALEQEGLGVIGMFVILVAVVAAEVFGDQLIFVVDQEPIKDGD
jgi:hypothetical protein